MSGQSASLPQPDWVDPWQRRGRIQFWACLESSHSLSAVQAVWRRRLKAEFDVLRHLFLERDSGSARTFPCPHDCGCAHEIIEEENGNLAAVCRCEAWNCDDLSLDPEDVVLWRLSWSKLGRALCRCFGLEPRPRELGLFNTRQIGAWPSGAVPAILTIQPEPGLFRQVVLELSARLPEGFILLAPTSRNADASDLERLLRCRAGLFDLESCAQIGPGGVLSCVTAPGELFSRVTPQPKQEERSVLERAFGLVKALEKQKRLAPPGVMAVFDQFCMQGRNISQIARSLHCSRGTISNRLRAIRKSTGMDPAALRQVSSQFSAIEEAASDSRARKIWRRNLVDDSPEENED
jgi:hypothetical protein